MALILKQCSQGHYYQGEECPYCNVKIAVENNNRGNGDVVNKNSLLAWKICSNSHSYSSSLKKCPYCEDETVIRKMDMCTLFLCSLKITLKCKMEIKVDEQKICDDSILEIGFSDHSNFRMDYHISDIFFKACSKIQIGSRIFSGKEFVKFCDFMIDCVKEIDTREENW